MTGRGDAGEELRAHWAELKDLSVPTDVVASAKKRARVATQAHRRPSPWAALAAAAVVLLAVVVVRPPDARPLATPPPSADVTPPATPTASVANALRGGDVAEVTRSFAIVSDRRVEIGQRVLIVEGPVEHEDEPAYLVQHWGDLERGIRPDSDFGWLAAADAEISLRPVQIDCPTGEPSLTNVAALQVFERPVCFGDRDLTFGPVTASDYAVGVKTSRRWLSADGRPDFFTGLPFYVNDVALQIPDGAWVQVTGHFDDPSSADCGDAAAVARCRQRFFVTSVAPLEPPKIALTGEWRRMAGSPLEGRAGPIGVWTGTELVVWGGDALDPAIGEYKRTAAAYDPATDRWRVLPPSPVPGRLGAAAFWTGGRVLIWGGVERRGDVEEAQPDGLLLDPVAETWTRVPAAPLTGPLGASTWIGDRLVVFSSRMESGATFDPATGDWAPITGPGRDAGEYGNPALVWTGEDLIVIGYPTDDVETSMAWAAAWEPNTGDWRRLPDPGIRSIDGGAGVWTGTEVVLLFGANRALDPLTGVWRDIRNDCGAWFGSGPWTGRVQLGNHQTWDALGEICRTLPPEPERPGGGYREFGVDVWTGEEWLRWSGGNGGDGAPRQPDGVVFRPDEDLNSRP